MPTPECFFFFFRLLLLLEACWLLRVSQKEFPPIPITSEWNVEPADHAQVYIRRMT